MSAVYAGPYRLFSADVHSGAVSVMKFFIVDDAGEMVGINWGPELEDDCRAELIEAVRLQLTGLELVSKLFKLDVIAETRPLVEEYQRLGEGAAQKSSETV